MDWIGAADLSVSKEFDYSEGSAVLDTPYGDPNQKWSTKQFHLPLFMDGENGKLIS